MGNTISWGTGGKGAKGETRKDSLKGIILLIQPAREGIKSLRHREKA